MTPYPGDTPDGPRPLRPHELEQARSAARIPAVLLIVVGALAAVSAGWGLVQLPNVPAQMDAAIADIDANPQLPQDQKEFWKSIFTTLKEAAQHPAAVAGYVLGLVASLVVVLGGVKLMNLSGTVLPITASVLAMIPCTVGLCCLLGFPAGVWALVVVNRADVRAAIAANRTLGPPPDPDAQYLR